MRWTLIAMLALAAPALAQLGGWPVALEFGEAGLVGADPNAALWMREDIAAGVRRWLRVEVDTPKDQPPAKALIAKHAVKVWPTLVLLDWRGEQRGRCPTGRSRCAARCCCGRGRARPRTSRRTR